MTRLRPAKRSPGNPIPTKARQVLADRDRGACLRCGLGATEVHHRRSRRVRDDHTHCSCNLVSLCSSCHHQWAHASPDHARALGFIVRRDVLDPSAEPIRGYAGWQRLGCDGGIEFLTSPPGQNAGM